ncbi:polysaccharide deacetylase family protein [Paenibacillus sp. IB182496]|uniref:Polysaccharide deacetylase family protein n=2 Tax=Paenibacillus sabuli TaxID=2772509 RepID=A0A927GS11_9BACL|nr:polysaccharide deacetylase family protein [Paenibacillus sabuli]
MRAEASAASLYEQIQAEAGKRRVAPIDARVDRVWKAIPGYNGLEVDIERTYRLAAQRPPQEPITYLYREIPAKITLESLGAYPVYRGNPAKPMVGLMINVAWGNAYVEPMLQVLRDEGVRATFFFDGSWLAKNPELGKRIQAGGHELSNHAYTHPAMSRLDRSSARSQITRTEDVLKQTFGETNNRWFAPPSGDYNQQTVEVARESGLQTVLWTLDTVDWQNPSAVSVVEKIERRVEAGTLILMHPTKASSGALRGMIAAIREKGLAPGSVGETLSPERIDPVEGKLQF